MSLDGRNPECARQRQQEQHIVPTSGYFGGIGRSIAGAILGPGGPLQPP